jgi:drug/metabolite transporter (DMT)-like permease
MKINWLFLGFLGLNFILSTAGDTAAKVWAINPGQKWLWITVLLSAITSISFMLVIRQSGLTVGSTIMLLLTMLSTSLIGGLLIFKEHVTMGQWVGLVLAFVAVLFLSNIIKINLD